MARTKRTAHKDIRSGKGENRLSSLGTEGGQRGPQAQDNSASPRISQSLDYDFIADKIAERLLPQIEKIISDIVPREVEEAVRKSLAKKFDGIERDTQTSAASGLGMNHLEEMNKKITSFRELNKKKYTEVEIEVEEINEINRNYEVCLSLLEGISEEIRTKYVRPFNRWVQFEGDKGGGEYVNDISLINRYKELLEGFRDLLGRFTEDLEDYTEGKSRFNELSKKYKTSPPNREEVHGNNTGVKSSDDLLSEFSGELSTLRGSTTSLYQELKSKKNGLDDDDLEALKAAYSSEVAFWGRFEDAKNKILVAAGRELKEWDVLDKMYQSCYSYLSVRVKAISKLVEVYESECLPQKIMYKYNRDNLLIVYGFSQCRERSSSAKLLYSIEEVLLRCSDNFQEFAEKKSTLLQDKSDAILLSYSDYLHEEKNLSCSTLVDLAHSLKIFELDAANDIISQLDGILAYIKQDCRRRIDIVQSDLELLQSLYTVVNLEIESTRSYNWGEMLLKVQNLQKRGEFVSSIINGQLPEVEKSDNFVDNSFSGLIQGIWKRINDQKRALEFYDGLVAANCDPSLLENLLLNFTEFVQNTTNSITEYDSLHRIVLIQKLRGVNIGIDFSSDWLKGVQEKLESVGKSNRRSKSGHGTRKTLKKEVQTSYGSSLVEGRVEVSEIGKMEKRETTGREKDTPDLKGDIEKEKEIKQDKGKVFHEKAEKISKEEVAWRITKLSHVKVVQKRRVRDIERLVPGLRKVNDYVKKKSDLREEILGNFVEKPADVENKKELLEKYEKFHEFFEKNEHKELLEEMGAMNGQHKKDNHPNLDVMKLAVTLEEEMKGRMKYLKDEDIMKAFGSSEDLRDYDKILKIARLVKNESFFWEGVEKSLESIKHKVWKELRRSQKDHDFVAIRIDGLKKYIDAYERVLFFRKHDKSTRNLKEEKLVLLMYGHGSIRDDDKKEETILAILGRIKRILVGSDSDSVRLRNDIYKSYTLISEDRNNIKEYADYLRDESNNLSHTYYDVSYGCRLLHRYGRPGPMFDDLVEMMEHFANSRIPSNRLSFDRDFTKIDALCTYVEWINEVLGKSSFPSDEELSTAAKLDGILRPKIEKAREIAANRKKKLENNINDIKRSFAKEDDFYKMLGILKSGDFVETSQERDITRKAALNGERKMTIKHAREQQGLNTWFSATNEYGEREGGTHSRIVADLLASEMKRISTYFKKERFRYLKSTGLTRDQLQELLGKYDKFEECLEEILLFTRKYSEYTDRGNEALLAHFREWNRKFEEKKNELRIIQ